MVIPSLMIVAALGQANEHGQTPLQGQWEPLSSPDCDKQFLRNNWLLKSTYGLRDTGEEISLVDYVPVDWMEAVVPGTLLATYVKNGIYPDPYYDINNKRSENLIPDASDPWSPFMYCHWYRTTFTLDESNKGHRIWLNLDGINWKADIYVNGQAVGKMAGMFKRGKIDITSVAQVGENALAIKVYPLEYPGKPRDRGCGGDRQIGYNAATMYVTIGWDFTIVDGIRDRNIGIYRDVYVTNTNDVTVDDPYMSTHEVPGETADLVFKTYLTNWSNKAVTGTLRLDIQGGITLSQEVSLEPNRTKEIVLTSTDHPELIIKSPRVWWPNGRGNPELYDCKVSFITKDVISDVKSIRFGIRYIEIDTKTYNGQLSMIVNGQRMFIQGGNWVQDAMLKNTKKDYDIKLRQIAQAGINLLRLWSASGQESDYFFQKCDELGILTWVESGQAVQVNNTFDPKLQLENWADTILRIRSHPCVAVYCGSNEGLPISGTRETAEQYDCTRWYQDSSQDNGQRGSPYRWIGIDTLYDYTCHDIWGSGPLGPLAGFCNETGNPVLPPAEVLKGFIPSAKLWPVYNNPEFNVSINYHDGGGFHLMTKFIQEGAAQFGSFTTPDLGGRIGIENYTFKGQILGAMEYRADSEIWKRNKWNIEDEKYNTGYAIWTINNANPMASARIANYSGEANSALYYFAHGNRPVHVQYDYCFNDVSLVNDTPSSLGAMTLRAEVRNLDWSLAWTKSKTIFGVEPDVTMRNVFGIPHKDTPGFDDVHFVYLQLLDEQGKQLDDVLYWRTKKGPGYGADGDFSALMNMPGAKLNITSNMTAAEDKQVAKVTLTNNSHALAFFIRLKVYTKDSQQLVESTYYEDNYFSILPGKTKTIQLDYYTEDLKGEEAQLIVEGWNFGEARLPIEGSGSTTKVFSSK
ncbi:MAG: hypothetical protein M0Q40_12555 [Limnochordia bacterium]|nr:hypothetical protein [Limnochordia bacterium]